MSAMKPCIPWQKFEIKFPKAEALISVLIYIWMPTTMLNIMTARKSSIIQFVRKHSLATFLFKKI